MNNTACIPCGHLVATVEQCNIGRKFPHDCAGCAAYAPALAEKERTQCEVWSRVMGYHRPVSAWNAGKQQEHRDRKQFREECT